MIELLKASWLNDAFDQIDAKHCENEVNNGVRTLFKVVKAFQNREDTGQVFAIAEQLKKEMEDFQPYLPLIIGLRNPGMRERHWEQVTELAGEPVNPEIENFCLQKFIDLGLSDKAETMADIGDRAGKEFGIELGCPMRRLGPILHTAQLGD